MYRQQLQLPIPRYLYVLILVKYTKYVNISTEIKKQYSVAPKVAKANNIANNAYQRWANFRVQGFQVLAGASYKFDF